ncbi:MAG: hypothetical protein ABSD57_01945 [Verrucomicrobiota bacterium]
MRAITVMLELISSDKAMAYRFLVGIFMCLMLPFASLFLMARVRSRLGTRGVIAGLILLLVVIPVVLAITAPAWLESPYIRFTHKDQKYYAEIARACDSLLQQHPTFSKHTETQNSKNDDLWIDASNVVWNQVSISGRDPMLPKTIRALRPYQILVAPNHVCIWIGVRPDYTINWGQDEMKTNSWTLTCGGEGVGESLYIEKR